jgi:hypothetical protein
MFRWQSVHGHYEVDSSADEVEGSAVLENGLIDVEAAAEPCADVCGRIAYTKSTEDMVQRTSWRAILDEPNISSPPTWLPSPTAVCETLCAFLDVASEYTMMTPLR